MLRGMRHGLVLIPILLAAGCGGGDPELTADSFKTQYRDAYCDRVFRCCNSNARSYGGKATCTTQVEQELTELLRFASSTDPVYAKFLPAAAKTCLDRITASNCDDPSLVEKGCATEAVQALHNVGEECTTSVECQTFYCSQSAKLARGVCATATSTLCSGDDRACGASHYCLGTQCLAIMANSEICSAAKECESYLCDPSTKTCVPKPTPYCNGK
jgi:hypothetical protein